MFKTEEELLKYSKKLKGKTFGEIDKFGRLNEKNKGQLGHIIEESYFGYKINSNSEADFKELGIELKVTPVKSLKGKNKYSSKERLVFNTINYIDEYGIKFEESSFWNKNKKLLVVFYLDEKGEKDVKDFIILDSIMLDLEQLEEFDIIKKDWMIIQNRILNDEAHLISERDTKILSACTKGANKNSLRNQKNTDIMAKQRAYSFKSGFMSLIFREFIGHEKVESILTSNQDLESYILKLFKPYSGKTINEIAKELKVKMNSKRLDNITSIILKMLDCKSNKLENIREFADENIMLKVFNERDDKNKIQHISFPTFNPFDLILEEWETSEFRTMLVDTKFLFVHTVGEKELSKIKQIKFISIPMEIIDGPIKDTWQEAVKVFKEGVKFSGKIKERNAGDNKAKVNNNLPGVRFNNICHVRPHSSLSSYEEFRDGKRYSFKLPVPTEFEYMTKQCFWLDYRLILEILDN